MNEYIFNNEQKITSDYIKGLKDGIKMYAWWKNGVQYVGTCGKTLKAALEEIDKI